MYLNPGIAALASITAPPIAASLISQSERLPFQVALGLDLVSLPIIFALQSSEKVEKDSIAQFVETSTSVADALLADGLEITPLLNDISPHYHSLRQTSSDSTSPPSFISVSPSRNPLITPPLIICYVIFFLTRFASMSQDFTYQYLSRVFGWSFTRTAQLQFVKAVGAALWMVLFLPAISTILIRKDLLAPQRLDLYILRASAIFAVLGPLILWSAGSTSIFLLGKFALIFRSSGTDVPCNSHDCLGIRGGDGAYFASIIDVLCGRPLYCKDG